jgi:hypothetical protein
VEIAGFDVDFSGNAEDRRLRNSIFLSRKHSTVTLRSTQN